MSLSLRRSILRRRGTLYQSDAIRVALAAERRMKKMETQPLKFEDFTWEGFGYPSGYIKALFDYVSAHPFKKGLEVGFDEGASALAFLRACPDAHLHSVDIAECQPAEDMIHRYIPEWHDRFFFYGGTDSRRFLGEAFSRQHYDQKFDFIYIDGDHLYDAVKLDLHNSLNLLANGGYMIVDDADPSHQHFGVGRAVDEFCAEYGYQKWDLEGSPSKAVVLRRINDL